MGVIEASIRNGNVLIDECDEWLLSASKWQLSKQGYVMGTIPLGKRGKTIRIRMHRAIYCFPLCGFIDHINGIKFDNRRCNLRTCTALGNSRNRRAVSGAVGFKGVQKRKEKFIAVISECGKLRYLGSFKSAEMAARKYDAAATSIYGDFAATNASLGLLPSEDTA